MKLSKLIKVKEVLKSVIAFYLDEFGEDHVDDEKEALAILDDEINKKMNKRKNK